MIRQMVLIPIDRYERLVQKDRINEQRDVSVSKLSDDVILSFMPPKVKAKAQSLLTLLSDVITWNASGEISQDNGNHFIPNSNIADLIRICLNNYKNFNKFIGIDTFCKIITDNNVPLTLLSNCELRSKIESLKGGARNVSWLSL